MLSKQEIGDGVLVFSGKHPAGIDVTATVVFSGRSGMAFDSLCYPEDTRDLLRHLKNEHIGLASLVSTHWHLDHTAGNRLLSTRVIAQNRFVQLIKTELPAQLATSQKVLGENIEVDPPNETFDKTLEIRLGEKKLTLLHSPGHTPDSLSGYLEEGRTFIAGDDVMELPYVQYGNSGDLLESLRYIRKLRPVSIIQGHGKPCDVAKVEEDINYIDGMRRRVEEGIRSGEPLEKLKTVPVDALLPHDRASQLHPVYSDHVHKANIAKVYTELTSSTENAKVPVASTT